MHWNCFPGVRATVRDLSLLVLVMGYKLLVMLLALQLVVGLVQEWTTIGVARKSNCEPHSAWDVRLGQCQS